MADNLTDAQKVMAEVMDLHRMERWSTSSPGRFEWWAHCTYCDHRSRRFSTNEDWENHLHNAQVAHLAVEIDKALGKLTRERGFGISSRDSSVHRTRFVGGWTPEAGRPEPPASWCPLESPCHADVLLAIANQEKP